MSAEKFGGFEAVPPDNVKAVRPGETLKGFRKTLWEKTKAVLSSLGLEFSGQENLEVEKTAVSKIGEIRNKNEEDKFLDLNFVRDGENLNLRTIAQIDPQFDPDRRKNYDEWDLTPEEEATRWLNREILVNEKLHKFTTGDTVSADELVQANRDPKEGTMFLLKRTKEQERQLDQYGEAEGGALARSLLGMQTNLRATEMINEIMAENSIKTKLEMEQKVFEDYFDHFDGYLDNSRVILEDLGDEELASRLEDRMVKFRDVIESHQLGEDEYSFVHGNISFDSVKYSKNGRAYLSDWQRAGKTQNKELSLVYDLGNAFQEAVEKLDAAQAEKFINGVQVGVRGHYKDQPEVAEAIINLTKLRSFAMILNEVEDDKKAFVLRSLGE